MVKRAVTKWTSRRFARNAAHWTPRLVTIDRSASSPGAIPAGGVRTSKVLSRKVMEPLPCMEGSVARCWRFQRYGSGFAVPSYTRKLPLPTTLREGSVGSVIASAAGTVKLQPESARASWVMSFWLYPLSAPRL